MPIKLLCSFFISLQFVRWNLWSSLYLFWINCSVYLKFHIPVNYLLNSFVQKFQQIFLNKLLIFFKFTYSFRLSGLLQDFEDISDLLNALLSLLSLLLLIYGRVMYFRVHSHFLFNETEWLQEIHHHHIGGFEERSFLLFMLLQVRLLAQNDSLLNISEN